MSGNLLRGILLMICVGILLCGPECSVGKKQEWGYKVKRDGVYWAGKRVVGADPETFEWIKNAKEQGKPTSWGRDARRGYFRDLQVPESDGPTFEAIFEDDSLAKDANYVYHGERYIEDRPWFSNFGNSWRKSFATNAKFVRRIEGADGKSFHYYEYGLFKDDARVYKQEQVIEHADPKTYHRLPMGLYADDKHVYSGTSIIEHADPTSIRKDEATGDLMDDNFVYVGRRRLEVEVNGQAVPVKSSSWRKIGKSSYKTDGRFVFLATNTVIPDADPDSFKPLGDGYAKDLNAVWYDSIRMADADPKEFTVLTREYTKDSQTVWYRRKQLPGADPKTFQVLPRQEGTDEGFAIDRSAVWYRGAKLTGADPYTFVPLPHQFGKDSFAVWYRDQLVKGVDAASFRVNKDLSISDKYGIISDLRDPR